MQIYCNTPSTALITHIFHKTELFSNSLENDQKLKNVK